MAEKSEIQEFFKGKDVLLTGGTGFLGKLLVEKLLSTCLVNKIYLLIRCKKGRSQQDRYNDIFQVPLFDPLKKQGIEFMSRVMLIPGDCALPDLGLTDDHKQMLIDNVGVVFHVAATVRFDQTLRTAAYINVRATQDIINMSKQMPKLKAFVYVSTAYSNCPHMEIKEEFYEPTMSPQTLFTMLDLFDDKYVDAFTPSVIGKYPNTYAFTKCISEEVIRSQSEGLPVALVRPSIVISTYKEPIPGWTDNFYGPMGVSHGAALGLLRTLHAIPENKTDLVPADYVINSLLASARQAAVRYENGLRDVQVYNYVSSPENALDWKTYMAQCYEWGQRVPSPRVIWHCTFRLNRYRWKHNLDIILLHWIPAYIVDFIAVCLRKKPILVEGYKKIHKFIDVISFFTIREWTFTNDNTKRLWSELPARDKQLFPFSMAELNWDEFFSTYMIGGRTYLVKDTVDTIPAGKRKLFILRVAHYTIIALVWFLIYKLLELFYCWIF